MPATKTKKKKTKGPRAQAVLQALRDYLTLKAEQKKLEARLGAAKTKLLDAAITAGGAVLTPTHKVQAVVQERRSLSRDKLIERGVTPTVLEYATKVTTATYLRVDERNDLEA